MNGKRCFFQAGAAGFFTLALCGAALPQASADDFEEFFSQVKDYLALVASTNGVSQGGDKVRRVYESKLMKMNITAARIQETAAKKGVKGVNVKNVAQDIGDAYYNALKKVGCGKRTFTSSFTDDMTLALWHLKEQLDIIKKSGMYNSAAGISFDLKASVFPDDYESQVPAKAGRGK